MHNFNIRASLVFGYLNTAVGVLLALLAASSYLYSNEGEATIRMNDIRVSTGRHGGHYGDSYAGYADFVLGNFNLQADLTHLFHWNTKQLFVYLVAEYENEKYDKNYIVLWDDIIKKKERAKLKFKNRRFEYPFTDITANIKNNTATISLRWDTIPYVGPFRQGQAPVTLKPIELTPPVRTKRKLAEEKVRTKKKADDN